MLTSAVVLDKDSVRPATKGALTWLRQKRTETLERDRKTGKDGPRQPPIQTHKPAGVTTMVSDKRISRWSV